jgi:hypothetical protein
MTRAIYLPAFTDEELAVLGASVLARRMHELARIQRERQAHGGCKWETGFLYDQCSICGRSDFDGFNCPYEPKTPKGDG